VPEYEAALNSLTAPEERSQVRLALARSLSRIGRTREALVHLEKSRPGR